MAVNTGDRAEVPDQQVSPWREVGLALALSLMGTAALGGPGLFLLESVWWGALAGLVPLFGAGVYLGWRTGEPEPFNGALLALLYYGVMVAALFFGSAALALPEPLPGLAIGDSTFFFVWPLLQLAAAVAGSVAGGLRGRKVRDRREFGGNLLKG